MQSFWEQNYFQNEILRKFSIGHSAGIKSRTNALIIYARNAMADISPERMLQHATGQQTVGEEWGMRMVNRELD